MGGTNMSTEAYHITTLVLLAAVLLLLILGRYGR
jgi:hypothetical protein